MTADPVLHPHLFTVDEYERMGKVGILAADIRTELLDGVVVETSPVGLPHASITNRCNRLLVSRCGERALVVVANPIRLLPRSEPQPDLMIVRWRDDYYATAHPTAADAVVVIEVSDSSIGRDRTVKVPIYARQGVPEVWVVDVDVAGDRVLVHTRPDDGEYELVRAAHRGETLAPELLPDVTITVDEILGER